MKRSLKKVLLDMVGSRVGCTTPNDILEVDSKGAIDFINGWYVSGRTRHIEVKQYFLRELKEQGTIKIV